MTNSATLTLTNGVALGIYGDSSTYGLGLYSGSFVSIGSPANLNWVARYNTVQEQSTTSWSAGTVGYSLRRFATSFTSDIRFTGFSILAGGGYHYFDNYGGTGSVPLAPFSHSRFGGGLVGINSSGACTVALTNCLWERVYLSLNDIDPNPKWYLFNNLFYGGSLSCYAGSASTNLACFASSSKLSRVGDVRIPVKKSVSNTRRATNVPQTKFTASMAEDNSWPLRSSPATRTGSDGSRCTR